MLIKDLAASILWSLFFFLFKTSVYMWDLPSPQTHGCLRHQMSCSQRRSKSDKHAGWTSEENLAACSSAISALESSYKKHLLHFVLSMMLWKIDTVMACLPLLSLCLCGSVWVSMCMHASSHALPSFLYLCFGNVCVCRNVWQKKCCSNFRG